MKDNKALADSIIEYSFYLLFFFVPLIWLPFTNELFEFNKMMLVYVLTGVILVSWIYKSIQEKKFSFKRTPFDLALILFLLSNLASTIFSIDRYTSIFGYYSRFHGGLLSTFSYLVLYWALVTFFDKEKLFRLLKVLVVSSFFVALYGVLQHPTPFFKNADGSFRGIDAGYWSVESEKRVFSTLGHPNWLAAFLLMVTPIAAFFLATSNKLAEKIFLSLSLILFFAAFTFTYSRGGTIGFVGMILIFSTSTILLYRKEIISNFKKVSQPIKLILPITKSANFFIITLISWLIILYFFGNAFLTRSVNIPSLTAPVENQLSSTTSETGKLRLIVWKGSFEIFKHYPLLGSGLETFAFSYYRFRPLEQNLTTDWDVKYDKAHNEFFNYLATTGVIGTSTYLFLIISFIMIVITIMKLDISKVHKLFVISLVSSYAGYHIQNLFGFSVVPIALLFFLIPAFLLIVSQKSIRPAEVKLASIFEKSYFKLSITLVSIFAFIYFPLSIWLAEFYYSQGSSATSLSDYRNLKVAAFFNPIDPLYKANLGLASINIGKITEGTEQEVKIKQGISFLNYATFVSSANIDIWRIRLEALYNLSNIDKRYLDQTIQSAIVLTKLAPTEAQINYNLASMYLLNQELEKARKQIYKVLT